MAAQKKFKSGDVNKVYHKAFKENFDWEVLGAGVHSFLTKLATVNNSSVTMIMAAMLPLTSALCGPRTRMKARGSFTTVLNTYTFGICDPGGGKSVIFDKIINTVAEKIYEEYNIQISLDYYSNAGLERHQVENSGYGLITSDEGHRYLAVTNRKQQQKEGDRTVLCKFWDGKGSRSVLAEKDRGFGATSMSMALFIQPEPLVAELAVMGIHDGFLDRVLFMTACPHLSSTSVIEAAEKELERYSPTVLVDTFLSIFSVHRDSKEHMYEFGEDAQKAFNDLNDEHANEFNSIYRDAADEGILLHIIIIELSFIETKLMQFYQFIIHHNSIAWRNFLLTIVHLFPSIYHSVCSDLIAIDALQMFF
jgi:hypothetical protein